MSDQPSLKQADSAQITQIMTTEHFTLQTARSATISDANGRTTLFLGSVSSTLVALAFVGQVSNMGEPFALFALVLFPVLIFIGLTTFIRVLETAIEDIIYAWEINRIRHYYAEIAPIVQKYFIQSTHDDWQGMTQNMAIFSGTLQIFLTTAGMVSVVNSALVGVFTGIALRALVSATSAASLIVGVAAFLVSVFLHVRYQRVQWNRSTARLTTLFPAEGAQQTQAH